MASSDARLAIGAGLVAVALAGAGVATGAWPIRGFALFVLLGAALSAFATFLDGLPGREAARLPPRWLALAGALAAASLAALHLVETLGTADGPRSPWLEAALAAAALVLLAAAWRRARPPLPAPQVFALGGGSLVVVGVGLGLSLGDRALGQTTALSVAATALAVTAVLASATRDPAYRPRAAGAAGVVLAALAAAWTGLLVETFGRSNFGPLDRLFLALHVLGVGVVAVAAILAALPRSAAPGLSEAPRPGP